MNARTPVRVGVIGLGKIAQTHHLPNLAAFSDFDLTRVCDLAPTLVERVARQYGLAQASGTTDYEDLLDGSVDALVVANRDHFPVVRDACAAGIPVFVEKPVCWSLREADQLSAVQTRSETPIVVGYMKRYDAAVERLLDEATTAEPPLWVRAHNFAGGRHKHESLFRVHKATPDERQNTEEEVKLASTVAAAGDDDARTAVYRLLAELAIHHFNLVAALYGRLTVTFATAHRSPAGWCVNIRFTAGPTHGTFEVLPDFASAREWDERLDIYHVGRSTELVFGSPFLRHEPTLLRHHGSTAGVAVSDEILTSRENPFKRELAHFLDVVRDGATPRTPLREATDDLVFLADVMQKLTIQ